MSLRTWKDSMVALRLIAEGNGKKAHRAAQIVKRLRGLPEIIDELRTICEAGGKQAHRTAELISELLCLPDWIDGEHQGLRDAAEQELDRLCRMIALTSDELLCMIRWFPALCHWDKADLCTLRNQAITKERDSSISRRATQRLQPNKTNDKPLVNGSQNRESEERELPPMEPQQIISELADEHKSQIQILQRQVIAKDREIARLHATMAKVQAAHAEERSRWQKRERELLKQVDALKKPKLVRQKRR